MSNDQMIAPAKFYNRKIVSTLVHEIRKKRPTLYVRTTRHTKWVNQTVLFESNRCNVHLENSTTDQDRVLLAARRRTQSLSIISPQHTFTEHTAAVYCCCCLMSSLPFRAVRFSSGYSSDVRARIGCRMSKILWTEGNRKNTVRVHDTITRTDRHKTKI